MKLKQGKPVSDEVVQEAIDTTKSIFSFDATSIGDLDDTFLFQEPVPEPEKSPERKYKVY